MLICYEIGFPEMARIQVQKGADILVYTSAFGRARDYVWDIASRSRALENGAFVVACNRCGQEKDTAFGARWNHPGGLWAGWGYGSVCRA